jgi:hypothetical protein
MANYTGRTAGIGLNEYEHPLLFYVGSGRQPHSRQRSGEVKGDVVRIVPSGKMTEAQGLREDTLFYDAIQTNGRKGIALASSGIKPMYFKLFPGSNETHKTPDHVLLSRALAESYQHDMSPKDEIVPIVGAFIGANGVGALGFVSREDSGSSIIKLSDTGRVFYVSSCNPLSLRDDQRTILPELEIPAGSAEMRGRTAQEIANNVFELMGGKDSERVFCAAAALWLPDERRWDLAVKDK